MDSGGKTIEILKPSRGPEVETCSGSGREEKGNPSCIWLPPSESTPGFASKKNCTKKVNGPFYTTALMGINPLVLASVESTPVPIKG